MDRIEIQRYRDTERQRDREENGERERERNRSILEKERYSERERDREKNGEREKERERERERGILWSSRAMMMALLPVIRGYNLMDGVVKLFHGRRHSRVGSLFLV